MGKISLEIKALRFDKTLAQVSVLLVSVHDHKSRFIGHYCLMEDLTQLTELEAHVQRLTSELTTGK